MSKKLLSHGNVFFSYPKRAVADQIDRQLFEMENRFEQMGADWTWVFPKISGILSDVSLLDQLPGHQILGWLRIASAFRKAVKLGQDRVTTSLAALEYLRKERRKLPSRNAQMGLNWVLDRTLFRLGRGFEGAWIKEAMTPKELQELQNQISQAEDIDDEFDADAVAAAIDDQVAGVHAFATLSKLTNFDRKIDALFSAASGKGRTAKTAKAALRYVASVHDVIPDDTGILGLLDDLFAVEWAYAVVEEHAHGLPLLYEFQNRWPHIDSSFLMVNGSLMDRFVKYAIGSSLQILEERKGAVVLREASAFLVPIAAAAALGNLQMAASERDRVSWPQSAILNLLDYGHSPLRVRFLKKSDIAGGDTLYVEAAQNARLHIRAELESNIELANRDYRRLANGRAVKEWERDHSIDPLHFLLSGRPRGETQKCVLLVASRSLVDLYLSSMQCRGEPIATMIGATWVTTLGREEPLAFSTNERAALYACATPETAAELILDPPEGVTEFDVIVHGAAYTRRLKAILAAEGAELPRMISICGLAESPGPGSTALNIRDLDVVPFEIRLRGGKQSDPLARGLARQYNHWVAHHNVVEFPAPALASIAAFIEITAADDDAADTGQLILATKLRRLLFEAGRMLPRSMGLPEAISRSAMECASYARSQSLYDDRLTEISEHLSEIAERGNGAPDIFSEIRDHSNEREPVFFLGASSAIAEAISNAAHSESINAKGITIQDLVLKAPVALLIVPGWLGAETIRRTILEPSAAQTEIYLFDFQKPWFDNVTNAARRKEKSYGQPLRHFPLRPLDPESNIREPVWPKFPDESITSIDEPDFVPPVEVPLDISPVFRSVAAGNNGKTDSLGLPVLLGNLKSFVLMPPHGTVITIPDEYSNELTETEISVPVMSLCPGDVFALLDGSQRGLLDELAHGFLEHPEETTELADLWRLPLENAYRNGRESWKAMKIRMEKAGIRRVNPTYQKWLLGETIAPRNYQIVIPIICAMSDEPEIAKAGPRVVIAVDQVYEARMAATAVLAGEIASGNVDWGQMRIQARFGSQTASIRLYRAEAIGEAIQCHRSDIWQIKQLKTFG